MPILAFLRQKVTKSNFERFLCPKSTLEGTFRKRTFKVRSLKVSSKVDFGQKKSLKSRFLGFRYRNFYAKTILSDSVARNQLLRALLDNKLLKFVI